MTKWGGGGLPENRLVPVPYFLHGPNKSHIVEVPLVTLKLSLTLETSKGQTPVPTACDNWPTVYCIYYTTTIVFFPNNMKEKNVSRADE